MSLTELYETQRPGLAGLAYRMLGLHQDVDDVLQEAWLKIESKPDIEVRRPAAYLKQVVTRLCLDRLRARRKQSYVGPWLPEPLHKLDQDASASSALADSLSMAFMVLLEQLGPVERAVYLLREVFDCDYELIAETVERSEANCRQIFKRSRDHLKGPRRRFEHDPKKQRELLGQFLNTCQRGDFEGLLKMLSEDASFTSDGGGKTLAARQVIRGRDKVARFIFGLLSKAPAGLTLDIVPGNGGWALLSRIDGRPHNSLHIAFEGETIQGFYSVLNPDKLKSL